MRLNQKMGRMLKQMMKIGMRKPILLQVAKESLLTYPGLSKWKIRYQKSAKLF